MSIFISYSHKDAQFVDRLSTSLIENNVKVWKDSMKLVAGDPILSKIRAGIKGASYFCVVLSKHSVKSKWVTEEINEALMQEAKERGIVVLPIVIDDCEVPPLLGDRILVDFRTDFASGLRRILTVVADKYNLGDTARIDTDPDYFFDYGIEQKWIDGRYFMQVDVVSFDREEVFSILSQFKFRGNEHATPEHFDLQEGESLRDVILKTCAQEFAARPARIMVKTKDAQTARFTIGDSEGVTCFEGEARVKWLGGASRGTLLFNIGALFGQICAACNIDIGKGRTAGLGGARDDRPLTMDTSSEESCPPRQGRAIQG
jgi:hypothetical protein